MLLDNLATRYHLLPSEIVRRADALDVLVMDVAVSWEQYQRDVQAAKARGLAPPAPKMNQQELQAMLEKVRAK